MNVKPLIYTILMISYVAFLPVKAQNNTDSLLGSPESTARAHDVPSGNAGRYFLPGAAASADNIFPSSFSKKFKINARFKANYSLSCGKLDFYQNFQAEIKRLQHTLKNKMKRAQKAIIASVQGAITSYAEYALMKINPTLTQLSIKKIDKYIEAFELNVKTCNDYQRDLSKGKNPLSEIVQIAVGDQWKTTIGMVNRGEKSLDEAEEEMIEEAKKNGVEMADGKRYGGEDQPPINITKSLVSAGMNLIMGRGDKSAWESSFSVSSDAKKNNPILTEFKSAKDLFNFVEDVYGSINRRISEKTTTGESVKTVAGRGYEKLYSKYRDEFIVKLRQYINRTMDRATFISETGHIIPPAEIEDLRASPSYPRAVSVEEMGQEYAAKRIKNNLIFAKQALKTGIYAPDMQQSSMKGVALDEYKSVYYRILDDISEINQRVYQ